VPRPGRPERTAALQHAKAQPGTLAIPAASQIIAAAKVRVPSGYGRDRSAAHYDLSDDPCLVFGAPCAPATCAGEHLKPMNRLSDSIIQCVHSKPNGYRNHQTRRSGHYQEGDLGTPLTMLLAALEFLEGALCVRHSAPHQFVALVAQRYRHGDISRARQLARRVHSPECRMDRLKAWRQRLDFKNETCGADPII
jgi:hypothetical protein